MVTPTNLQSSSMTGDRLWEICIPREMLHGRREVEKFISRAVAWGVTHDESLALLAQPARSGRQRRSTWQSRRCKPAGSYLLPVSEQRHLHRG
jgi:hypothetical protein